MSFRHFHNVRGFFSDYFLGSVLGRGEGRGRRKGLSDQESALAYRGFRRLRGALLARVSRPNEQETERFMRSFLYQYLGFHLGASQDRVHKLYASSADELADKPALALAYVGDWAEELDAGRGGQNPARRLFKALAAQSLPYGFLFNGERARLLRAEGDGPAGAYLEADLENLDEEEDQESFALFLNIFRSKNFILGTDGVLPLAAVEVEARKYAQKVGDDLKGAVFTAAESLVQGLVDDEAVRAEAARLCGLLPAAVAKVPAPVLRLCRDAALLALYRLLFIFYAEARDAKLRSHEIYRGAYSVETLVESLLLEREAPAANRSAHWQRVLATFRVYDKGLPKIQSFRNIPPRGGDFFSGETPEAQVLAAALLPDTLTREVLLNLATLPGRRGVGRERIAFNELDIENLGRVYEGLLEHEPKVAESVVLEVKAQGRLLALSEGELKRLCDEKELKLKGAPELLAGGPLEGLHVDAGEDEDEGPEEEPEEDDEGGDGEEKEAKLKKGSALRVLRRFEAGHFYFVPGGGRKGSGSFYTPLPLVQDLIRHALAPRLRDKTPAEIEGLRILDPSCGSGHFLVEAMRAMGQALHLAYWRRHDGACPPEFGDAKAWTRGDPKAGDLDARKSGDEARAWCKRRVAERCLFGVDLNPTAVQLARVALWIESLAGDRPLTFFQHHIRHGNSLLGTWMDTLEKPPLEALDSGKAGHGELFREHAGEILRTRVTDLAEEAARLRRAIDTPGGGLSPESIQELDFKQAQLKTAEGTLAEASLLFDLRSAAVFEQKIWNQWDTLCSQFETPGALTAYVAKQPWESGFRVLVERERFFHWELEFPELFLMDGTRGFDAILGNPPWEKVKPDKKEFYAGQDVLIRTFVGGELDARVRELQALDPGLKERFEAYEIRLKTLAAAMKQGGDFKFQDWEINGKTTGGDPDLFRFFVERSHQLLKPEGRAGLVVPSALYNNEGCAGLRHLLLDQSRIERFYAFENRAKVFPIDSRFKFVSLCFSKVMLKLDGSDASFMFGDGHGDGGYVRKSVGFDAAFMRQDLEELHQLGPRAWDISIQKSTLEKLSPGTLAFLEYRSPKDQGIVERMYTGRTLLGDKGASTWNAKFYNEYHLTADKDLWTQPNGRLYSSKYVLGKEFEDFVEIRARMAKQGFWPLYEGKCIEQWMVDTKPVERWVNLEIAEKSGHKPEAEPKLVFRDIASNTNERTCIAAVLPAGSCFGNTLSGLITDKAPDAVATVMNSFVFDYVLRFRTAGMHLNFTYVKRMPLPDTLPAKRLKTRSGNGQAVHVSDEPKRWEGLVEANLEVAEAYGVSKQELAFILNSFPGQTQKRPEFMEFFRKQIL